jgi:hypothetical protein
MNSYNMAKSSSLSLSLLSLSSSSSSSILSLSSSSNFVTGRCISVVFVLPYEGASAA